MLRYWLGEWDDALAELGPDDTDAPGLTYSFLRERWSALLLHGVSALIAGRRDERTVADQQLRQGLALPIQTVPDRENQDFLVAAHALALEQSGETRQAMLRLAAMLPRRDGEMTLIHQWLPDLVRLAPTAGDRQVAQAATQACQAEAAAETHPARATVASLRCHGLLESDPGPLRNAVAHYFNGRAMVDRVLSELAEHRGRVVLVINDVHELASTEAHGPSDEDIALGSDLRAVALMNLGTVEAWSLGLRSAAVQRARELRLLAGAPARSGHRARNRLRCPLAAEPGRRRRHAR